MSGPQILAQSLPDQLSFPSWRRPVLCRLKFTTGASNAVTIDAVQTTPGLSVTAVAGLYAMTFPGARNAQVAFGNCAPATPGTIANHRFLAFQEPNANAGTLAFRAVKIDGTENDDEDPEDGSVLTVLIWLDLG